MTTLLAGVGPAGRGVLTAALAMGMAHNLCDDGFVIVEPDTSPGGGRLGGYGVRSDSAAAVFAMCVGRYADEPELVASPAMAQVRALPDGTSIALPWVGALLTDATVPLLSEWRTLGADVRLGTRVGRVRRRGTGLIVDLLGSDGGAIDRIEVDRVIVAVGGRPYIPKSVLANGGFALVHSDELLQPARLGERMSALPPDPRIVVIGRAHSAFSVANQLLSHDCSRGWGPGSVTVATRGQVRVTYASPREARADGAVFSADDVCPQSNRVWRLCGLRGDAAHRYRLSRDGLDRRLTVRQFPDPASVVLSSANLVVAATGYRSAAVDLVEEAQTVRADGAVVNSDGTVLPDVWAIGLGSGSRGDSQAGGEPSYQGPVDGVWHYQEVVAPRLLRAALGHL